ncbi:MAG TPA: pyridoxal-phosphate dependent enzyme [Candidatus Binatia bacterium]|nr:pyridoxal-phosphate dependent enzyme [Candidatus Binatia bacterium]
MSALPDMSAIREAQQLLRQYFAATPLARAASLSGPKADVYLKLETALPTGSFKPRGAMYALIKNLQRGKIDEVTASSTGNHGAATAFAAQTLGVPATIFLPENPNPVKRKKIEDLGARIVSQGSSDLAAAFRKASEHSRRPGVYFLNDATDPDLPAGPATIGVEILGQCEDFSAVFVPMGDTALIRGVGGAIKQLSSRTKVIGVQAERAPSYVLSWRAGKPVPTDTCNTCADGLATRTPEAANVAAIREVVDDVVLVSEDQMMDAIRHLYLRETVLAEPAGAAATAAYLANPISGRVALLVSGGNITDDIRKRAGAAL